MGSFDPNTIEQLLIWLIPGVLAITLHEIAHGWVAMLFGDTTARDAGRLTLNPLKHIDPVGTIIIPGLLLLARVPFVFGWAKPVPVDFCRLRGGRWGTLFVASAGVVANLLMLAAWLAVGSFAALVRPETFITALLQEMAFLGVAMNLALILFNLVPLPPLDGGRIVGALLPSRLSRVYMRLERYGIVILLVLVATGAFSRVFMPVLDYFLSRI